MISYIYLARQSTIVFSLCYLNVKKMEKELNYPFNRRSENYFDWLYHVIRSEKYYQADAVIVMNDINSIYLPKDDRD
ncbi:hypothetical protein [Ulvibacter antarcticus]|nr:hypothetical protein [Ulvibacter antarcticus]